MKKKITNPKLKNNKKEIYKKEIVVMKIKDVTTIFK